MKILFIDKFYPKSFDTLLRAIANDNKHEIIVLSQYNRPELQTKNVKYISIHYPSVLPIKNKKELLLMSLSRRADVFLHALENFKETDFIPDVIHTTSEQATALYARTIFPDAKIITYITENETYIDAEERKTAQLFENNIILDSDLSLISVEGQRNNYNSLLSDRFHLLHEGINTELFSPPKTPLQHKKAIVSMMIDQVDDVDKIQFFCKNILQAFEENTDFFLTLYTRNLDENELKTLKIILENEKLPLSRYNVLTQYTFENYLELIRASDVCLYMSSKVKNLHILLEALSMQSLVLIDENNATFEIIKHGENAFLSNLDSSLNFSFMLCFLLKHKDELVKIRENARDSILNDFEQKQQLKNLLKLYEKTLDIIF